MSKTIAEHYQEIIAVKEGRSELDGLTPLNETSASFLNDNASGSRVAIWRLWCWIMATISWINENLFEAHKKEVEDLIAARPQPTLRWYQQICFTFQYSDALIWNGKQYVYADTASAAAEAKRIIKRAAVVKGGSQLQFKIAKLDGAGKPVKLTIGERTAFEAYLEDMAYPGTNTVVISEDPDQLKLQLKIYFDALQLNPDGSSTADPSAFPVKNAVNAFVQNLPFNGRMNVQKLADAIQGVPGVVDLELPQISARYGNLPYQPTGREYIPFAGHMVLDEASSSITYQRYV